MQMTSPAVEGMASEIQDIETSTDTDALVKQLQECMSVTLSHVIKAAAIVKRLEECNVDITISPAMLLLLRKVAYGQVLPELLVTLQGSDFLLQKASILPLPEQANVAGNQPIKVMQSGGAHRKVRPLDMTRREISQVFCRGQLRSETEQIGWLSDQREKQAAKREPTPEVNVDKKRGGIVVNGVFLSSNDMVRYLGTLASK